ncbi:breast carcinoma-amplified sequence 1 isoform X2 [Hippoglossus stenolepis]|uniref:breast carcinoma-amplified sequence 1 isoform X2 n=1 Tax=Hippoglossus stenolepis TaxID=195615 RepID=UPI001FAF7343|nr:breast carcinoma-amplified sequence 1 isoform X2 [Hippoglossus stenolepis]
MGNEQSTQKGLTQNGKIPEKHENGSANGVTANITSTGMEIDVNSETVFNQSNEPFSLNLATESTEPDFVVVEAEPAEAQVVPEIIEAVVQVVEAKKNKSVFGKMFKKKPEPPADVVKVERSETSNEDVTDGSPAAADPQPETATADLTPEAQSPPEPDCGVTADAGPEEDNAPETDTSQPEENQEESEPDNNPVMNFFKTLVTPTKTTKKETAAPDATKDQTAQVSEPPAAPKGMSIPPPPPPEPPKMEIRGEAAAKPAKPTPKDEPKAAAKQPEPSKGKAAKSALSKLFRPKTAKETPPAAVHVELQPGVEEQVKPGVCSLLSALQGTLCSCTLETPEEEAEAVVEVQSENKVEDQETAEEVEQPVVEEQVVDGEPESVEEVEKVDPSKTGTLEAAAKPEPPPPVQEEKKKTASKSPFLSFFKPKDEPKKATPAPAAAAAEAAQTVKAKEEPKAAAKSVEVVVDNKQASVQAADDAANVPKKLEKRNSIGLFFKGFGLKRHSTDAGVQAEPAVAAAAAAEKAK